MENHRCPVSIQQNRNFQTKIHKLHINCVFTILRPSLIPFIDTRLTELTWPSRSAVLNLHGKTTEENGKQTEWYGFHFHLTCNVLNIVLNILCNLYLTKKSLEIKAFYFSRGDLARTPANHLRVELRSNTTDREYTIKLWRDINLSHLMQCSKKTCHELTLQRQTGSPVHVSPLHSHIQWQSFGWPCGCHQ